MSEPDDALRALRALCPGLDVCALDPTLRGCLHATKHDHAAVARLEALDLRRAPPLIPYLLTWLQDPNWPVAGPASAWLVRTGRAAVPDLRRVLESTDDVWASSALDAVVRHLPSDALVALRPTLEARARLPDDEEAYIICRELLAALDRSERPRSAWVRASAWSDREGGAMATRRSFRVWAAAFGALVVGGCDSEPKLNASQRFAIEHHEALSALPPHFEAVEAAAAAAPALADDGFTEAPAIDLRAWRQMGDVAGDTRVVALERLQGGHSPIFLGDANRDVEAVGRRPDEPARWALSAGAMKAALATRYALVLRTVAVRVPTQEGEAEFHGGSYSGEALLYRLADAAFLGGVRFAAISSTELTVRGAARNPGGADRDAALRSDLARNAQRALGAALRVALPEAVLGFTYAPAED